MYNLCNLLHVDKIRTSPHKPSAKATAERLHKSLNAMIAKCLEDYQKIWTGILPFVMSAYRSAIYESTGFSPNFLYMGHEVHAPVDLMLGKPTT
jgi:hypothetical protein